MVRRPCGPGRRTPVNRLATAVPMTARCHGGTARRDARRGPDSGQALRSARRADM